MSASIAARQRLATFLEGATGQVARNSSWSIATTTMTASLFFVETVVLARHLGKTGFGVYVLVIAYPEAVQLFLDFRTREAMTRYLGSFLARGQKDKAVAIVKLLWLVDLCVVVGAFLIVFATAPLVAPRLTDDPNATQLMRVFAVAMLLGGLDATAGSVLRVFERFGLSFLVAAGSMIPRLAIIIALVSSGAALEGIVWGRLAAELWATLVAGGAAFVLLKRALWPHRAARLSALAGSRREILRFLGHMNLQGSIRAAASKLDVLAVGALAGPGTASIYKIGVQFGSSPLLFADPLFSAVYPTFTRLHAVGDDSAIRTVSRKLTGVLSLGVIPVGVALAVASESLLRKVVGDDFAGAWITMVIVLAAAVPVVIFFWGRAAMLALGDPGTATAITGTAILVQFVLLVPLVVWLDAAGAALALASMNVVTVLLTVRYARRKLIL